MLTDGSILLVLVFVVVVVAGSRLMPLKALMAAAAFAAPLAEPACGVCRMSRVASCSRMLVELLPAPLWFAVCPRVFVAFQISGFSSFDLLLRFRL